VKNWKRSIRRHLTGLHPSSNSPVRLREVFSLKPGGVLANILQDPKVVVRDKVLPAVLAFFDRCDYAKRLFKCF
jgi:hypothetical protein